MDEFEAKWYFKKAADKGNSFAMNEYALMARDSDACIKYLKIAIEKGNPSAMYNYGVWLRYGIGVKANKSEAIRYIKMAADNGCQSAIKKHKYLVRCKIC